jgi:ERCC4-type nuclease
MRDRPFPCPFTVIIDSREKAPWTFTGITSSLKGAPRPVVIACEFATLKSGDYSIKGFEDQVAIERKSKEDLYSTLGQNRERFEREHERLSWYQCKAVVIEASWNAILTRPPDRSSLNPKSIFGTATSWWIRYGVPWFPMEDRRLAELKTFDIFEKFWKEFGRSVRT